MSGQDLRAARDYLRGRIDAGDKADAIILDLVHGYGARFTHEPGHFVLRLAGITESVGEGPITLLRTWLRTANAELRVSA